MPLNSLEIPKEEGLFEKYAREAESKKKFYTTLSRKTSFYHNLPNLQFIPKACLKHKMFLFFHTPPLLFVQPIVQYQYSITNLHRQFSIFYKFISIFYTICIKNTPFCAIDFFYFSFNDITFLSVILSCSIIFPHKSGE